MLKAARRPRAGGSSGGSSATQRSTPSTRYPAGFFLLSASGLLFEVALTRLCSAALSYHLTFLVVGAALLGTGAGGTWVALRPGSATTQAASGRRLAQLALGAALAIAAAGAAFSWTPLRGLGGAGALLAVVAAYPLLALPYGLQGAAMALALRDTTQGARRGIPSTLYGAALLGAAAGALAAVPVMDAVSPPWAVSIAAGLSVIAAALFARLRTELAWAMLVAVVALAGAAVRPHEPNVLATKPLARYLDTVLYPDATHSFTHWDGTSRVDVFQAPGVSLLWDSPGGPAGDLPEMRGMTIDGDALTAVLAGDFGQAGTAARRLPASLPFAIAPRERVLVIGPGGGLDVEAALAYGAKRVDAVEVNGGVAAVMLGPMASFTDNVYGRPGVRLVVEDGRSFLRRAAARGELYDAIVLTAVDSWAAVAGGAYSLAESYLYTQEAFAEYYDRLNPDGVVAISRWYAPPASEIHRLAQLAQRAVAREAGEASRQAVALRAGALGTLVVRRGSFTEVEAERARAFARTNRYALTYDPSTGGPDAELSAVLSGIPPTALPRPPTDDRPFFFDATPWQRVLTGGAGQLPQGHAVLLVTLVQSLCLVVATILLPLRRLARTITVPGRAASIYTAAAYFSLAGLGFALAQVALLQRYQLLLGHPSRAMAVVLTGMLAGAGLGSLMLGKTSLGPVLGAGAAALALHAGLWHAIHPALAAWEEAPRALVALLTVAAASVPLGAAVPAGLAHFAPPVASAGATSSWAPWAWGINAAAGVLGVSLAMMLAMDLGLTAVLGIAGLCYLGAALLAWQKGGVTGAARPAVTATGGAVDRPPARRTTRGAARAKIRYA